MYLLPRIERREGPLVKGVFAVNVGGPAHVEDEGAYMYVHGCKVILLKYKLP